MTSTVDVKMGFKTFFKRLGRSTKEDKPSKKGSQRCSRFVDSKIFQPEYNPFSRNFVVSPATFDLPHEIVRIKTKDGLSLFGYLVLQTETAHNLIPTILMYHGNGGNIGDCLQLVEKFYQGINCNILVVEYRGFGLSEGVASEQGVYLDSQAAFDYVDSRPDLDSTKIILYGISLGGAVAIDLARNEQYKLRVTAIIVENTFASLDDLVVSKLPKCCKPAIKLFSLSTKFPNGVKIRDVVCPTLFISGMKDELISPSHMTQLFMESRAEQKKIIRFPEGGHLTTWCMLDYTQQVGQFIGEAVKLFSMHNQINNNHSGNSI